MRFVTDLTLDGANHISEWIHRDNGALEYLKSYRLSDAQTRRAYLLRQFSRFGWNIEAALSSIGCPLPQMRTRIEQAGLTPYIRSHVLARFP